MTVRLTMLSVSAVVAGIVGDSRVNGGWWRITSWCELLLVQEWEILLSCVS